MPYIWKCLKTAIFKCFLIFFFRKNIFFQKSQKMLLPIHETVLNPRFGVVILKTVACRSWTWSSTSETHEKHVKRTFQREVGPHLAWAKIQFYGPNSRNLHRASQGVYLDAWSGLMSGLSRWRFCVKKSRAPQNPKHLRFASPHLPKKATPPVCVRCLFWWPGVSLGSTGWGGTLNFKWGGSKNSKWGAENSRGGAVGGHFPFFFIDNVFYR